MPIVLNKHCHSRSQFLAIHALGHDSDAAPPAGGWPAGAFEVGKDFFTIEEEGTLAYLQGLIDTTYKMRKKLTYLGGNAQNAKALIAAACTDSGVDRTVRWGVHQSQERPQGVAGKCQHFTIVGDPADWHLYVATDGKRISFMSDGPANFTKIIK